MTIQEAIRKLARDGSEIYCKICTVDAVDTAARTVDVTPVDGSAPLLGVNLQANQDAGVGVVLWPRPGSYVVTAFLHAAAAAVVLTEDVERITLTVGQENPVEALVEDGAVTLSVGETRAELAPQKKITLNGGGFGGIVKIQELTDRINALVDKFNTHTHTLAAASVVVAGSATTQKNASPITVPAITSKAEKLKKGDYENDKITHG